MNRNHDTPGNIESLFEAFIKECQFSSRLHSETIRNYRSLANLFMLLMPEAHEISSITPEIMTEFFKRLQTRERTVGNNIVKVGVKSSTIKTYMLKLSAFFEWSIRKGHTTSNPIKKMRVPKLEDADQPELKDIDVRKLYSTVTLYAHSSLALRRDTVMLSLLLFCGLRFGEFISLEVRDVDLDRRFLTVRGETSKGKRTRVMPIHPTLFFHLKDYISERNKKRYTTHYLIVSIHKDRGLSRDGLKHWIRRLSLKAGVKFHLHMFRHAFATNLARHDVHAVKIQKLLGHSSLDMTMTYLRSIKTEDLHDDIQKLSI